MAKVILDDFTGKVIQHPYISLKYVQFQVRPGVTRWLGSNDTDEPEIRYFESADTMAQWVAQEIEKVKREEEESRGIYRA